MNYSQLFYYYNGIRQNHCAAEKSANSVNASNSTTTLV